MNLVVATKLLPFCCSSLFPEDIWQCARLSPKINKDIINDTMSKNEKSVTIHFFGILCYVLGVLDSAICFIFINKLHFIRYT